MNHSDVLTEVVNNQFKPKHLRSQEWQINILCGTPKGTASKALSLLTDSELFREVLEGRMTITAAYYRLCNRRQKAGV